MLGASLVAMLGISGWDGASAAALVAKPASGSSAGSSSGGQVVVTGHDFDKHCSQPSTNSPAFPGQCNYLAVGIAYVRNGSTLPVLALDSSFNRTTGGTVNMKDSADFRLSAAMGTTTIPTPSGGTATGPSFSIVNPLDVDQASPGSTFLASASGNMAAIVKDPTDANFDSTNWPLVDANHTPLYSAVVIASKGNAPFVSGISARAADLADYLNNGGGIMVLSTNGQNDPAADNIYYSFLKIQGSVSPTSGSYSLSSGVNRNAGAPMGVSAGSYEVTDGNDNPLFLTDGAGFNGDDNCCGTHNSFSVSNGMHIVEIDTIDKDANGVNLPETLMASGARIVNGTTFVSSANLTLNPSLAPANQSVTVGGSGFQPADGPTSYPLTVSIEEVPGSGTYVSQGTCAAPGSGNTGDVPGGCTFAVPPILTPGVYNVQVDDGNGDHVGLTQLFIPEPQPKVGKVGTNVRLFGANFPAGKGVVPTVTFTAVGSGTGTVTINQTCKQPAPAKRLTSGCIASSNAKSIVVKAPTGASGLHQVSVGSADALVYEYVFDYGPAILKVAPTAGTAGTLVRISGGHFGTNSKVLPTVSFGSSTVGVACTKGVKTGCIVSHGERAIAVRAPSGLSGLQKIQVSTPNGAADDLTLNGARFDYGSSITSVSPQVGAAGTTVVIRGYNFPKAPTVNFGSTPVSAKCSGPKPTGCIVSSSARSISVKAPLNLSGLQSLSVAGAADLTAAGSRFDYGPAVTSLSTLTGTAGTRISIKGGNFGKGVKSFPTVKFGSAAPFNTKCANAKAVGCIVSLNPTNLVIRAPSGLSGLQPITIVTPTGSQADVVMIAPLSFDFGPTLQRLR